MTATPPSFLRDFNRKAEMLGFKYVGLTGTSHPRYHNADVDAWVVAALTPSDWRSQKNTLSQMERLSGRKLPRSNSGHFRNVRVKQLDTTLSAVEAHSVDRIDTLLGQAEQLQQAWTELIAGPANRTAAADARDILENYENVRRELAKLHRIIPPLAVA